MPRLPILLLFFPFRVPLLVLAAVVSFAILSATAADAHKNAHKSAAQIHASKKARPATEPASIDPLQASLRALPPTQPIVAPDGEDQWVYRCDPYILAAMHLQALGKSDAYSALLQLADWEDQSIPGWHNHGYRAITLCRMLFVPKDDQPFRRPGVGLASFLGNTSPSDWPLTPITLINQIPFLIILQTGGADYPESSVQYVQYCMDNCDWNSSQYHPVSEQEKEQALQQLLALPVWKGKLSPAVQFFFSQQIIPGSAPYLWPGGDFFSATGLPQ